jgi:anti-anti-sigma regulatory factor
MHIEQDGLQGILKVSGALDIADSDDLRHALAEYLKRAAEPRLDCSGIEACGAAFLQLVWSARCSAQRLGKPWRIVAVSGAMEAAGAAIGLPVAQLSAAAPAGVPEARNS